MRPSKDRWYLKIAEQVALRSTCLRRNYGAVIVKEDEILSTGYGGAPRKTKNCNEVGFCYRDRIGAKKGEHYELCRGVHAEQNAIIQARRIDMLGATLYLVGLDAKTKKWLSDVEPCPICKRIIINAGIKKIIAGEANGKQKCYPVEEWVQTSLAEFREEGGQPIPVMPPPSLSDHDDKVRRKKLISFFNIEDAVVVQTTSFENRKQTVGKAASKYFLDNVKNGNSVALSCGETILSFLESLPYLSHLRLDIHQLSIEGDPAMIHQAPATLVGLLRGKCSPLSSVYGLQLPPIGLSPLSVQLREQLAKSEFLVDLKNKARNSDYVFLGVGSVDKSSASFWAMAQAATNGKFSDYVAEMGLIGEINNQVYDGTGIDRTNSVPELAKHLVNVLSLDDIRSMAGNYPKHKVVMVASGPEKTIAMRVALRAGLANVLITGKEDADRLLGER